MAHPSDRAGGLRPEPLAASQPVGAHPLREEWEALCLSCDPFEGDFGGGGSDDGILSDKMVTARKSGDCHTCAGPIEPGTRVRRRAEVYDGDFMRFGWCEPCCRAMASYDLASGSPDEGEYEARFALGQARRASAIEARRAETAQTGSVHESAGPKDDAQPSSGEAA